MSFRSILLAGFVIAALAPVAAEAALTWTSAVGGAPDGVISENFDTLTVGGAGPQIAPTGLGVSRTGTAGVVQGAASGLYAAPSLSGGNGDGFGVGGGHQGDGANGTPYLTAGSSGAIAGSALTITLPASALYFGLLWGSVDSYNTLSFFDGATLVGTLTGSDIAPLPNGDQGPNGTRYVNVTSTLGFDRVVATSTSYAFEFDNVAFMLVRRPVVADVPEPATLTLLGVGLLGLGLARRRRDA